MNANDSTITRDDVLSVLGFHIGKRYGIPIGQLVREIAQRSSDIPDERRVRQLIEELRRDGHHICATPHDGYFIAQSMEELQETCQFLFDRAMTSLSQVAAMKKVSLPDLAGQLHLKT